MEHKTNIPGTMTVGGSTFILNVINPERDIDFGDETDVNSIPDFGKTTIHVQLMGGGFKLITSCSQCDGWRIVDGDCFGTLDWALNGAVKAWREGEPCPARV